MNELDRRAFLKSAAAAAAATALPYPLLARAGAASGSGRNVLVFIFMRGGADGMALVPPHGDAAYYKARPTIALKRPKQTLNESVVDLDSYFGLHPALAPLKPLWDDSRFAIIQAAGCYALGRSHFDAQEFVETGTPGVKGTPKGFLTRSIDHVDGPPLTKAISFSRLRPRGLQGPDNVLVTRDLQRFDFDASGWHAEAERLLRGMYAEAPGVVGQVGRDTLATLAMLRKTPALNAPVAGGAVYPDAFVGSALRQAAQVVKANIGTRCIFVDLDGTFDTHSDQLINNQLEFEPLARAIAAFYKDLGVLSEQVTTLVASEFGRALEENGAKGTDHGSAGVMMLFGGRTRGGKIYGRWPGLEKSALYEERDLAVTSDFRDIFAEVVKAHLGVRDVSGLFPRHNVAPPLGLFG
jgi:uncharacterized protein (DUF1501 family)